MNSITKFGIALLSLLALPLGARGQQFAVKTNLLFDAALTPDIGVEFVTGEHSSVALSVFGHWNPYGMQSKLIAVQPEFRYWFNGRPMVREYIGATLWGAAYDIALAGNIYQGDAITAGLTGGYVLPLSKRMNIELSAGFGVLLFKQKKYLDTDHYDEYFVDSATRTNATGYKLFPAKLGVTFIYIIK